MFQTGSIWVLEVSYISLHICFPSNCYISFQSEAQELTIVKMSKFGGGIGAPSKEERLKEAADIHLRLGQIQRYCELMVELGQVWRVCVCVVISLSRKHMTQTLD